MTRKIAFVFPGQGSQTVGMLGELGSQFPIISETYAQASERLGYDLWGLVQNGPEEQLNQTEKTQPALLAGSVAIWRLWQDHHGENPILLAGHSLGEYSALVCAGALDFASTVELVALRGRFMQEAVEEGKGAMAAIIGLDEAAVNQICQEAAQGQVLSPANFNAIGQIVVAGETAAVQRAIELAKSAGAKMAKLIPVSVPSHCVLMKPAAEHLAERLQTISINPPQIPVINNVDVCCYQEPDEIRSALIRQLYSPVRWVETIELMAKQGVELVVECGPGKVLTGLNKRIDPKLLTISLNTVESFEQALPMAVAQ